MKEYPNKIVLIDNLENFDFKKLNTNEYVEYKGVKFYYKINTKRKNLLVSFHGSIRVGYNKKQPLPVFRFYSVKSDLYDVLCISDKLLETFYDQDLILSWYLSTTTHKYSEVYESIIKHFVSMYDEVVFTGSSGGGLPAFKFGCIFNKKVLIQNSQLYLSNYQYFNNFCNIIMPSRPLNYCIENIIFKHGTPSYAYIYQNIKDVSHMHSHFLPFKKFVTNIGNYKNIEFIDFCSYKDGDIPHNRIYPDEKTHHILMQEIFK